MDPLQITAVVAVVVLLLAGVGAWVWRSRRSQPALTDELRPEELPQDVAAHARTSSEDMEGISAQVAAQAEGTTPSSPSLESPESIPGRMERLRARLAGSGSFGRAMLSIMSRDSLSESDWEDMEDTLLTADLGLDVTTELLDTLKTQAKVIGSSDPERLRAVLRDELLSLVGPDMDRSLDLDRPAPSETAPQGLDRPAAAVLMVGVNGTGKTTTCGKLARVLVAQEHSVLMGAADTFRAAAADQLSTWGERVGVDVVRADREGADPASVAYDAVREAAQREVDVVLVDTAGRLQNKAGLMDELGKIKRVMEKVAPINEILLVLDATTGQNGMRQAQVFAEAVGVTGIVLTKLDGTAKGGIVVTVQRELGVPVKFVGLGEGADDLAPFDPVGFVDALLA